MLFSNRPKVKQVYLDNLKAKSRNDPEWWERKVISSSKSFLTAVSFRETALSTYEKTGNVVLPTIGYYYSVFHLSLSILKVDHTTELTDLVKIKHARLFKLVESKLLQPKLVSKKYYGLFAQLKELRDSTNYKFGYNADLMNDLKKFHKKTKPVFQEGVDFIKKVTAHTDTLFRFQVGIGDGFGDDILDSYLAETDKGKVFEYLIANELTS